MQETHKAFSHFASADEKGPHNRATLLDRKQSEKRYQAKWLKALLASAIL